MSPADLPSPVMNGERATPSAWTSADSLAAVDGYGVMSTADDPALDDIVRLAAETFQASIAFVALFAGERLWVKAAVGTGLGERPLGSELSSLFAQDVAIVTDSHADPELTLEIANGDDLRFYASATLRTPSDVPIGLLCVLDHAPRPEGITAHQRLALEVLARQIVTTLELRRASAQVAEALAAQNQAETAHDASEARYRLAAQATNDALWEWDFTTNLVRWNEALHGSYGHAPDVIETTGDWWIAQIHPDDRARIDTSIHAAIDGAAQSWSGEYRFRRGDGSYAAVLDRGHIIRAPGGQALRMIGAMLDLSEQQESRALLEVSEERLRLATEAAEVGFWDVDVVNDVLIWPPLVKQMFGISPDTPVSMRDYFDGLHPDDRAATAAAYAAACDPDRRALYDVEYRTIGKEDGVVRWVAAKGRGLFDADGRCLRVVGTAIDVTARKRDEAALRESEGRLRFLRTLDEALQGAASAPAAMRAAAELLAVRLGASRCAYADVDEDSDGFVIRDDYSAPGVASSAGTYSLDLFGPRAVTELRSGQTLVVRDVCAELAPAEGRAMFQAIGIDAIICCPLVRDDRLLAMMAVHQDHARAWTDAEIRLVEAVVERCWAHVQRVGAESRLRDSEARYRTLFEAIDVGFGVVEVCFDGERAVDYRFEEANPAFERQTGLVGAVGQWASALVPNLEQRWFDIYGEVARTGKPVRFEDGSAAMSRWFDVHALRTGRPEQNRVALLFNDISARRAAEVQLRELNETLERQVAERTAEIRQYHDIVEATTSPICAFDTDYRLIAFNKAHNDEFRRTSGFETKLGDVFPDLFIPEQQARIRALMDRALAGERFTAIESFGRPEYGQPTWEISYTPLRDEHGAVLGAFHAANDITDRLRAEAELTLAQEALRQSQKMEAMGSLTGGVAHDFNNLLTPIVGSLDMLQRKGIGNEREQRLIAGALQSAERARTLVQRLLAFARRQPLQPRPVDVGALVTGMADLVASTSGPQTRVAVDVADDLPAAFADQNQLEMAVLNLSVNARDAMPDGGRLSIAVRAVDVEAGHHTGLRPDRYVCLSVADTGTGMDETTLQRAIEPFYSTKGIGKGTGLGLSMVHGLAAQLGGALTIDSRPGLGTDVRLWLPVTAQSAAEPQAREEPAVQTGAGMALVVDDEEIVRASTADMLTDLGYRVVEAGSAEDALRLVSDGLVPDLLVTDHLMPGKSGTELAREVLERLPDTRTLIVSGYAEVEGIAPDLPRLVKPFRQAELAASLAGQVAP